MSADDIIIAGMSINFYCQQESKMLPFEVDQDSNFLLEVYCVDGEFQGFIKLEPAYFLVQAILCLHCSLTTRFSKGQLISNRFFLAEDSPKKRTKTRLILVKTNSYVRFLGESSA